MEVRWDLRAWVESGVFMPRVMGTGDERQCLIGCWAENKSKTGQSMRQESCRKLPGSMCLTVTRNPRPFELGLRMG